MVSSTETPSSQALTAWRQAAPGLPREQAAAQLLSVLSPAIKSSLATYRAAPLPQATMDVEAKRMALEAAESYDPSRGASLPTHVGNYVRQKLYRYVSTYQNPARLPEEQVRQVGPLQTAVSHLTEQLGREPTTAELADHMVLPVAQIARLRKSLRPARLISNLDEDDVDAFATDHNYERAMMAYYSLSDQEKQVFDYSLGAHGQKRISAGDIALRLKVSPARVSALKASLAAKITPYMQ